MESFWQRKIDRNNARISIPELGITDGAIGDFSYEEYRDLIETIEDPVTREHLKIIRRNVRARYVHFPDQI